MTNTKCRYCYVIAGPTATEQYRQYPGTMGSIMRLVSRVMFKPPEDGAQTLVYCAVGDGMRDFSGESLVRHFSSLVSLFPTFLFSGESLSYIYLLW